MFTLYASGLHGIIQLAEIMQHKGLRNSKGGVVCRKRVSEVLKNPFYFGVIKIFRTGETFSGVHEPLITKELFPKVRDVMNGKSHHTLVKQDFLYRRCIQCGGCGKSLVAEKQKGHVYYRCKAEDCPTKTIREEFVDGAIGEFLGSLKLSEEDTKELRSLFTHDLEAISAVNERKKRDWQLQLSQVEKRIERLTDKFVDDLIDQTAYTKTRSKWLFKQSELREKLAEIESDNQLTESQFMDFLNWTNSLQGYYVAQSAEQKRVLLKTLSPNLSYSAGKLTIKPYSPFLELAYASHVPKCALVTPGSRIRGISVSKSEQNNAVEYELTKTRDGKFEVFEILRI